VSEYEVQLENTASRIQTVNESIPYDLQVDTADSAIEPVYLDTSLA